MEWAVVLEALMIVSFGISWPFAIIKSWRSRSNAGKSLIFTCLILFGYLCGILSKLLSQNLNLAFWFYIPNALMVLTDMLIYFRNKGATKNSSRNFSSPASR